MEGVILLADYSEIINTIRSAIYGRDMREAIAQGFEKCAAGGGTALNIDKTLTMSDWAADAKVVGDRFEQLENAIAEINPGLSREEKDAILAYFAEQVEIHPSLSEAYQVIYDLWNVPVSSITLSEKNLTIGVGFSMELDYTILPKDAYDQTVNWSVEPSGVVTVEDGLVYGVSEGDAVITASCGGKTDTCNVHCEQIDIYTITNSLTHYTNNNDTTKVMENTSYTAVLSIDPGYKAGTVTITMGGSNVTSTVYNPETRTITIPKVTGDVVITAVAVEIKYYSVTYSLTGCTASPRTETVEENKPIDITISRSDSTYIFTKKIVKMSSLDISQTAITDSTDSSFKVHIDSVTGNVIIQATAEKPKSFSESTWAEISEVSKSGQAPNVYKVGDKKLVSIQGQIGDDSNDTYDVSLYAIILGINHNKELEGDNLIHIGLGWLNHRGSSGLYAFIQYSGDFLTGHEAFTMATTQNNNVFGWTMTDVRNSFFGVLGDDDATEYKPTNKKSETLWAALPDDFLAVLRTCKKYTANTDKVYIFEPSTQVKDVFNTEEGVTPTIDYGILLSEYEIMGVRRYANQYEQDYQKQYDYFKNGNDKTMLILATESDYGLMGGYTTIWTRSRTTDKSGSGYQSRSTNFVALMSSRSGVTASAEDGQQSAGVFPLVFV